MAHVIRWQRCLNGSRILVDTLESIAKQRGLVLDQIAWLPPIDPHQPGPVNPIYTLVIVAGERVAHQMLSCESLEYAGFYNSTTGAITVLLGALLRQLQAGAPAEQSRDATDIYPCHGGATAGNNA